MSIYHPHTLIEIFYRLFFILPKLHPFDTVTHFTADGNEKCVKNTSKSIFFISSSKKRKQIIKQEPTQEISVCVFSSTRFTLKNFSPKKKYCIMEIMCVCCIHYMVMMITCKCKYFSVVFFRFGPEKSGVCFWDGEKKSGLACINVPLKLE